MTLLDPPVLLSRRLEAAQQRPPFVWVARFMPTAFSRRVLQILEYALTTRQWFVVFAQSGDGKSTTLRQFRSLHPDSIEDGVRKFDVLAARTPTGRHAADHLLMALVHGFGTVPNLKSTLLRPWLVSAIKRAGVRLIVIDDAHELTLAQLNYLRELTDQLADRDVRVGVVLLSVAGSANPSEQPLWRLVQRSGLAAVQFSNRLDGVSPLVLVKGLTRVELGAVLRTLEERNRPLFPELRLARFARSVFDWLTDERIDRAKLKRVRMGAVCDLVKAALEDAWADGRAGLDDGGEMLHRTAIALAARWSRFDPVGEDDPDEAAEAKAGPGRRRKAA